VSHTWALGERVDAPDVNDPTKTVMVRWRIIQTPLFGIYLHRLDAPDQRPTLHDHPWPFISIVLRGGYTETFGHTSHRTGNVTTNRHDGRVIDRVRRTWRARSIHRMRADEPHTITDLDRTPTWTLVLAGPRALEPSWGYWDGTGWTSWLDHPHTDEFEAALAARQAQTPR
jgi:hypothetical protein